MIYHHLPSQFSARYGILPSPRRGSQSRGPTRGHMRAPSQGLLNAKSSYTLTDKKDEQRRDDYLPTVFFSGGGLPISSITVEGTAKIIPVQLTSRIGNYTCLMPSLLRDAQNFSRLKCNEL